MPSEHAGASWTLEEEMRLYAETGEGRRVAEIAAAHGRTTGAIRARQKRLGLRDAAGALVSPLPEFKSYLRPRTAAAAAGTPRPPSAAPPAAAAGGVAGPPADDREDRPRPTALPQDFPSDGDWIEKLWHALRHDIAALPPMGQDDAMIARRNDIALTRLTPGDDFHPAARLAELGEKYGVSGERIRQIEDRTLRRLRAGVQRGGNLTAQVLGMMTEAVPEQDGQAPLSWLAAELARQGCGPAFTEFLLTGFLMREGSSAAQARRLVAQAMAPIRQIRRAEASARRRDGREDETSERVRRANAFVLGILKKAVWPGQLDRQPTDLSGFQPLRTCRYAQPYYSRTLRRLVGFDSLGERRLIRALDLCTVVTEFAEQPIEIAYRQDGEERTYVPDLVVRTDTDLVFVVEIKGRQRLADRDTLAKAQAAQSYLGPRGIGYCLVDASGFGLDDLRALEPDTEFEHRLADLMRPTGTLRRSAFEAVFERERLQWAYDHLQGTVLRNGMRYETWLIPLADDPRRYIFDFRLTAGETPPGRRGSGSSPRS